MTTEKHDPKNPTSAPMQKQEQAQKSGANAPNDMRSGQDAAKKDAQNAGSQTKPGQGERAPARDGADDMRSKQPSGGGTSPRSEKAGQGQESAPRLDDRPSQPRTGSGDEKSPASALPNRKSPGYGDTEPNDPRHLDVEGGSGQGKSSTEPKKRS